MSAGTNLRKARPPYATAWSKATPAMTAEVFRALREVALVAKKNAKWWRSKEAGDLRDTVHVTYAEKEARRWDLVATGAGLAYAILKEGKRKR